MQLGMVKNRNCLNRDRTATPTESIVHHNHKSNENNTYYGDENAPGFAHPQYSGRNCSFNRSTPPTEIRSKGVGNGALHNLKEGRKGGQQHDPKVLYQVNLPRKSGKKTAQVAEKRPRLVHRRNL